MRIFLVPTNTSFCSRGKACVADLAVARTPFPFSSVRFVPRFVDPNLRGTLQEISDVYAESQDTNQLMESLLKYASTWLATMAPKTLSSSSEAKNEKQRGGNVVSVLSFIFQLLKEDLITFRER